MNMKIIKAISTLVSMVLLFLLITFSIALIDMGKETKVYKVDYKELHSVKYGMFNSDIWTMKILNIVDDKINNFEINLENRSTIEGYVSSVIDTLISETERMLKEQNKGGEGLLETLIGSTKQMITDTIIDFKALHARVPEFTTMIMNEIEKPENQAMTKRVIREKLKEFMQKEFEKSTDMSEYNALLKKYNSDDLKECSILLEDKIHHNTLLMNGEMFKILFLALLIIFLVVFQGQLMTLGLLILTSTTLTLLVSGIMLPMLEIEAKVVKLYFMVLDKPIVFENQILFFQSKSISDLLSLLLHSQEGKMVLVGILLGTFSVIFPLLKVLSITIYFYFKRIGQHPIIKFFALSSTKWSMADVMVVSIFMAYLGLDGVVGSELSKLEAQRNAVNMITSNGTHLEVGFFLFLGFVFSSFVLSIVVKKSDREN